MAARPKIVLLGMLTKMPVGGVAWLVAQYAIGFERLGCDVYYVEAHARTPSMFVADEDDDGTEQAAAYLARLMERFGLRDRWAFHALHADGRCVGMSRARLDRLYRDAAVILNMHGGTVPVEEHAVTGRLALLGTDPVELEIEVAHGDRRAIEFLDAHAAYFTWGLNHGNADCGLPWAERYPFVPSPPPVVLDFWANGESPDEAPFTTIGNWRQHWREVTFRGEVYRWSKHHEFLKVLELPSRSAGRFELALSSYEAADRRLLEDHDWAVVDGLGVSGDIDSYRAYIVGSRGELSVAKDQNIRFRTGWFSERSATYLAAGRPVVVQDTGFGHALPTGEGLLSFSDLDSAAAAVELVLADEKRHRRSAVEIAHDYLAHDVVLARILDQMGVDVGPTPTRRADVASLPRPAPAEPPGELVLTPVSRRPLVLPAATQVAIARRPVPTVDPPAGATPAASVIVVVFENLAVTRLSLESVLANTAEPAYELIVVDNASSDATRQYLSVLAARNRHVRLVRNEQNRGFASGANQGLALGRGDLLVLLNNDTIVPPGWLAGLGRQLDDRGVGLVGPVTNRCGNEAEIPADYKTYADLLAFAAARDADGVPFDIPVATMFCAALRRDVVESVGLLDERFQLGLFEDDDYARRVRDAGYRVVCTPEVFVHHFGEGTLGKLAAEGRYGELFDTNRRRFEEKWGEPWTGHDRRPDPEYDALVDRVRRAVVGYTPPGSIVLVVSRGDERLVALPDRHGWHFPRDDSGGYAGHYPSDDDAAIGHLDALRGHGARYLVIPTTADWWLRHYKGFANHLEGQSASVMSVDDTAVIYMLCGEEIA